MKKKDLWLFIVLNAVNLLFFIIIMRQGNIVRADAPVGFFEFGLKKMIQSMAIGGALGLPILLFNRNADIQGKRALPTVAGTLILLAMGFFAFLLMLESCDDDKGHCRHFQLYEMGLLFMP